MDEPVYTNLRGLSKRLNVSPKTLRGWIFDPSLKLPAYKVKGCFLFNWAEVERWIEKFRVETINIEVIADELLSNF